MTKNLNEIHDCEVCGNKNLVSVLDLGMHPMCDDLVEVGNKRVCREYPIEILFCKNCITAHQRFQVPKKELFPTTYHYRSRFTADVLNGMKELVESCVQDFGDLNDSKVLDIGCNDGSLLDFFRERGAITIGIEPTGAYADAKKKGHFSYNEYLSPDVARKIVNEHGSLDFITFTNVFAHIENINEVLESLSLLMTSNTVIVIENHYLGAVFTGNQFDTFYHEHPRTYSYSSFVQMAKTLNTRLLKVEFPSRYGGNIRVYLGNKDLKNNNDILNKDEILLTEKNFLDSFDILRKNMEQWRKVKKELIANLNKKHGKLLAKAFPGRAAILVKLLNLTDEHISAVYEKKGSLKIGHYLPGTRIPIHSDEELFDLNDQGTPIINMAWHISKEIKKYLNDNNCSNEIINILNSVDFDV